jgi:pimeloyl-ACP methyl ester carboxylesterase
MLPTSLPPLLCLTIQEMIRERFGLFWHRTLGRPYRLHVGINQNPTAEHEVVLLHGIGQSSAIWQHVADDLKSKPYHLMGFDLLGFGASPKPDWQNYTVDDHAQAVIAAIQQHRRRRKPMVIVGHSMGCLIAVHIALIRPDLVDRLVLYQPPIYNGLPNKRRYNIRKDLYYWLYRRLIEDPEPNSNSRLIRLLVKRTGLHVQPEVLRPFLKSLQYTIMGQTTLQEMRKLQIPIDIIYGSRDMVVIRGKTKNVFKEIVAPLQTHTIRELHTVSKRASSFIARRITEIEEVEE